MEKANIRNLIAKNQLEEATETLLKVTQNKQWHNEVVLQSTRLNEYKKLQRTGTEAIKELNQLKNQITNSLLSIVDELPKEEKESVFTSLKKRKGCTVTVSIAFAATILSLLAAIAEFSGYSLRDIFSSSKQGKLINATVFVESKMGTDELRKQGYIFMDVEGGERKKELIDDKGTASFQNVKIGDQVSLDIDFSEPFKPKYPDSIYTVPTDGRIYLALELQNLGRVFGTVI